MGGSEGYRRPKSNKTDKTDRKQFGERTRLDAAKYKDDYLDVLNASIELREVTLEDMVVWISELGEIARELVEMIAAVKAEFKSNDRAKGATLKFECKRRASSNGQLYIAIRVRRESTDETKGLTGMTSPEARKLLSPMLGRSLTTAVLPLVEKINALNEVLTVLSDLNARLDHYWNPQKSSLLETWASAMQGYGLEASRDLQIRINGFLEIDEELSLQAFLFNFERGDVRWHSLLCRMKVAKTDPLGPSKLHFRVVTKNNRHTGVRISQPIDTYKEYLTKREDKKAFVKEFGKEPKKEEFEALRAGRRNRSHTPWITRELISHCRFGTQKSKINRRQQKIAACMEPWDRDRAYFQRLLHRRGDVCKNAI
jgi:hypothetical protein